MSKKATLNTSKEATLQNDTVEPLYLSLRRAGYKREAIRIQAKILAQEMNKK